MEPPRDNYSSAAMEGDGASFANPNIAKMYGGYNPFKHEKYLTLQRELDLYKPTDYIMEVGPPDRSYVRISSQTLSSSSQSTFVMQTTLQTLLSCYLQVHYTLYLNFKPPTGGPVRYPTKADVYNLLKLNGAYFLRPFPLQQSTQNYRFTFGGTAISVQLSQIINALLRLYPNLEKNEYITEFPSTCDTFSRYANIGVAENFSINNPNQPYGDAGQRDIMSRNITDFNFNLLDVAGDMTINNTLCGGVAVEIYELVLMDPFSLTRNGKPCLNGLNTYQWDFTYQTYQAGTSQTPATGITNGQALSRAFCVIPTPVAINTYDFTGGGLIASDHISLFNNAQIGFTPIAGVTSLNAALKAPYSFSQSAFTTIPELLTIQYSQVGRFSLFDNYSYPYSDLSSGFVAQTTGTTTVTVAAPLFDGFDNRVVTTFSNSNVNLLQVPKYFIHWVGTMDSAKDASCADWVMEPVIYSSQFQTTPALLSTAYSQELRALSIKNGWRGTRATAENVGFYLILAAADLGIPSALMVEGVISSFQYQVNNLTVRTPKGLQPVNVPVPPLLNTVVYNNLQMFQIPVYNTEIQVSNNRANVVCVSKVLPSEVPYFEYIDTDNLQSAAINNMQGGNPLGWIKSHSNKIKGMMRHLQGSMPHHGSGAHHSSRAAVIYR